MRKMLVFLLLSLVVSLVLARRDPTQPVGDVVGASSSKGSFVVSAIFHGSVHKTAIVNGETVIAGETVNNAKVLDVQPDYVVMENENGKFKVPLDAVDIKQTVMKKDIKHEVT